MSQKRCRSRLAVPLLLATLGWLGAGGASAVTIGGVEFSNWKTIDALAGVDFDLVTAEDLYVFIPNGLFTDQVTLVAEVALVIERGVTFDQNDPLLCDAGCDLESFIEDGDVVLRIFDPLGTVNLSARNIVVSIEPIPEPGSFSLLALGLSALARRRSHGVYPRGS